MYKKKIFNKPSELNQKEVTPNSMDILKMRYFIDKDDGTKETTFSELCRRVSRVLTSAEESDDLEYKKNIEKSIYNDMLSQRFLFNSPCLFNAGVGISNNPKISKYLYSDEIDEETYNIIKKNMSSNQQLFACFVVSFKDSLEDIFEAIKRTAIISKSGGGVGANLCRLRERGSTIKNGELGVSSGPISFMNNFNECLKSVSQAGKRRGAGMLMLDSNHPDIKDFIISKTEEDVLSNVNISVALDNKFMKAVKENADYCLISPKDGSVVKTIKAVDLFNAICENAWKRGDPGIFFREMANEDNLLKLNKDYEIFSTNPCCTGDTLVAVADGRGYVSIKELSDEGKDVPVYCEDNNHNIVIKNMVHPRLTKKNADILKITLDDGNVIKCTSNHKFEINTENGSLIKMANELCYGDSLKILTREINTSPIKGNRKTKGYIELYNNNNIIPFLEHRLISEYYYGKEYIKGKVIHHKDFNSLNNNINNLIPMSYEDHIELHTKNMYGDKNPMIRAKTEWSENDWKEYHDNMSFAVSGEKNGRYISELSNDILIEYMKELIFILNRRPSIYEFDKYVFAKTNIHCKGLFASKFRLKTLNISGYKDFSIKIANNVLTKNNILFKTNIDVKSQKRIIKEYNDAISQGYKTFIGDDNIVYVERICECCGNKFIEPYRRREVMYCSQKCVASSINHYTEESLKKRREKYISVIDNNKNEQLLMYTELKMELGREPFKKEWIKKCIQNNVCTALGRTEGRFKTYHDLKEQASHYNHRVIKVEYYGTEDVYNGTVEQYHNYYIGGFDSSDENKQKLIFVKNFNCGEQPLPDESSCNLCSINLYEFVDKENKTFNWEEFKNQIVRCIYYLDLVIDATKYPLPIIEKRTKAIRPVGLGFMGLADTFIELGYKYGDNNSLEFTNRMMIYMAKYSLISTIEIAKQKGSFKEYESVLQLLNQNVSYNKIVDDLTIEYDKKLNLVTLTDEELDDIYWVKNLIDRNSKYKDDILKSILIQLNSNDNNIPWTFKNALKYIYDAIEINYIYDLFNTGLRNSRRISPAPTGTISMILNSSSALEPNFAFEWDRWVVDNNDTIGNKRVLKKFYHKLNTPNNRNNGLLVTANELSWKEHLSIVNIVAQYTDSGVSKTINVPEDITVDEIKNIYMYCFDNHIKGTTIYRNNSRNSQPIISKDNKEENKKESKIDTEYNSLEKLPEWLPAIRKKVKTDKYGSLYVITSFYKGKPCEVYISAGKSGSQLKSAIEAISRVISIGLRSGISIDNIIRTMMGICESDVYVYDALDGSEELSSSIPDTVSRIIRDTMRLVKNKDLISDVLKNIDNVFDSNFDYRNSNILVNTTNKEVKKNKKEICPKCGSEKYILESGCHKCIECGYSPCG